MSKSKWLIILSIVLIVGIVIGIYVGWIYANRSTEKLTIVNPSLLMIKGEEQELKVNNLNEKIKWTSSDENIAIVDKEGRIYAINDGEVTITGTTEDGKKSTSIKLQIKENEKETNSEEEQINNSQNNINTENNTANEEETNIENNTNTEQVNNENNTNTEEVNNENNNNQEETEVVVNKDVAEITCYNKVYNGQEQTIAICKGGTISNEKQTKVGTYTITCKGDSTHTDAASKKCSIKDNNEDEITIKVQSAYDTGAKIETKATAKSGNTVTITYYSDSKCTKKLSSAPSSVGTYYVKAKSAGNSQYKGITSECTKGVVISKLNRTKYGFRTNITNYKILTEKVNIGGFTFEFLQVVSKTITEAKLKVNNTVKSKIIKTMSYLPKKYLEYNNRRINAFIVANSGAESAIGTGKSGWAGYYIEDAGSLAILAVNEKFYTEDAVIHEMGHKFDNVLAIDKGIAGSIYTEDGMTCEWSISEAYSSHSSKWESWLSKYDGNFIVKYGGDGLHYNPNEFFANSFVAYFTMPDTLKKKYPEIYKELSSYLGGDYGHYYLQNKNK